MIEHIQSKFLCYIAYKLSISSEHICYFFWTYLLKHVDETFKLEEIEWEKDMFWPDSYIYHFKQNYFEDLLGCINFIALLQNSTQHSTFSLEHHSIIYGFNNSMDFHHIREKIKYTENHYFVLIILTCICTVYFIFYSMSSSSENIF